MNEFVIKNGFISQGTSYVSDGNLGVGVTSPTSRLEVKGLDSSLSNFGLKVQNSGGTDNLVVRNDGNVGIGTSTPSYRLHVKDGTLRVGSNDGMGPNLTFTTGLFVDAGANNNQTNFYVKNDDDGQYFNVTSNGSYGRVGIGIDTNASARLHIVGYDTTSSNYGLKVQNSGGTDNLVVRNDGNVGIGITSPTSKLHISSPSNFTLGNVDNLFNCRELIKAYSTGYGSYELTSLYFETYGGNVDVRLSSYADNNFNVKHTSSLNEFNIGNSSIYTKLYHGGTNPSDGIIDQSYFGGTIIPTRKTTKTIISNNTGGALPDTYEGLRIYKGSWVNTSGTTYYPLIALDGNVGIGTSTPSETLEVNGKTKTTNFQMTSGGTEDYILTSSDSQGNGVWTPSYNLSSKDYGSFYDTTTQTGGNGTTQSFQLNSSGATKGISIIDLTGITVTHAGIYNIQFSAQINDNGGTTHDVYIWLRKNGLDIPNSNSRVEIGNNNNYIVAAWNFVEEFNSNDVINLMWYSESNTISILYDATPTAGPEIPSLILTITQI